MKKLILFLLPMLMISVSPAYAENWVKLHEELELDTDSIKVDGQYVQYRTHELGWGELDSLGYWVSDCTKSRNQLIKTLSLRTGGLKYIEKPSWGAADNSLFGRLQHEYVCKHYYRR